MVNEYINEIMKNFHPYKEGRWCYEDGILVYAFYVLYQKTKNQVYLDFVLRYYEEMISENGIIKNYDADEYNIDNIAPGIALFEIYAKTKDKRYRLAIESLAEQLKNHPRTDEGNFWHKKRYPYQVWLDGIYMGQVFLRKYALLSDNQDIMVDISSQLTNVRKYLYDPKRKLYLHAYDEKKVMQWADKVTGQSP
ncbi:MAG: glycoside hydrolase family 88 protein, partial [Bacilli bacterium]|nr:glycoside hydrolase family 88 protein [Bacilli bacterium]